MATSALTTAQSLLILGRQPALGLVELESLYGAEALQPVSDAAVTLRLPYAQINFARLGGSIKLCKILTTLDTTDWRDLEKYLLKTAPQHAAALPDGKLTVGLSTYGLAVGVKDLQATALRLKKAIRARSNGSVRIIPNQAPALSSAQILHNRLTGPQGWELVLVRHGQQTLLAQTTDEQDIEAYAARDQQRPKRDARVGMLPPKLGQIIINLATGSSQPERLLDPFCGTGVILQEAILMGLPVYGSDLEPRMVAYSQVNLDWLHNTHNPANFDVELEPGDATSHHWPHHFDTVAAEGYLGQPFNSFPTEAKLREVQQTCNQITKGFLKNFASQIPSGTRLCLALPAWHKPNGQFIHLRLLDQLPQLGYNRVSFAHARNEDLLYYRPGQVVARELVVITKH